MAQENGKKSFFEKIFKKNKPEPENKNVSANVKIVKGKVKEIIVESPLDAKYIQIKSLSLKIPKALNTLQTMVPKRPTPQKTIQNEKEQRIKQKRIGKKLSLLIISSEEYTKHIMVLLKRSNQSYQKILYVSLNEIFDNLIRNLETNQIDTSKFYIIDAITRTAQTNILENPNCTFVTSPNSLIELSLAISQKLEEMEPDLVIFDSLSTLFIYEQEAIAIKFAHSLIGKIKAAGCDAILTALEGDASKKAIKDLGMFVDEFLTMSEYQLREFNFEDEKPLTQKPTQKEEALKKELDKLFPQRNLPKPMQPQEKKVILGEMQKLKQNLTQIKTQSPAAKSLKQLEQKIQSSEKKPVNLNANAIHAAILDLRKKAQTLAVSKGAKKDKKTVEKEIKKFDQKIKGIGKQIKQKPKIAAKPAQLKRAIKQKNKSEKQVNSLEQKLSLLKNHLQKGRLDEHKFEKEKQKIEKQMKKK